MIEKKNHTQIDLIYLTAFLMLHQLHFLFFHGKNYAKQDT